MWANVRVTARAVEAAVQARGVVRRACAQWISVRGTNRWWLCNQTFVNLVCKRREARKGSKGRAHETAGYESLARPPPLCPIARSLTMHSALDPLLSSTENTLMLSLSTSGNRVVRQMAHDAISSLDIRQNAGSHHHTPFSLPGGQIRAHGLQRFRFHESGGGRRSNARRRRCC